MIAGNRYYLHCKHVEVTDHDAASSGDAGGTENWFDLIPAYETGTLRPALVSEGKLLKKGLASLGNVQPQ